MSYDRRTYNLGKRERLARKRRRRGSTLTQDGWLKVGRKHSMRIVSKYVASKYSRKSLAVADAEKSGAKRALESIRRT